MSKKIQVLLLTSSMLIIAFVMIGSLGVHASGASSSGDVTLKHIGVYSEVLYRVRAEYVEEPNMSAVTNGALHGLLESLDADSSYLTPVRIQSFQAEEDGRQSQHWRYRLQEIWLCRHYLGDSRRSCGQGRLELRRHH